MAAAIAAVEIDLIALGQNGLDNATIGEGGIAVDDGDLERPGLLGRARSPPCFLGVSPDGNIFFNTGHGHLNWTFAYGSAKLVAERPPEIDLSGLTFDRY